MKTGDQSPPLTPASSPTNIKSKDFSTTPCENTPHSSTAASQALTTPTNPEVIDITTVDPPDTGDVVNGFNIKAFEQDLLLIFDNAILYWGPKAEKYRGVPEEQRPQPDPSLYFNLAIFLKAEAKLLLME